MLATRPIICLTERSSFGDSGYPRNYFWATDDVRGVLRPGGLPASRSAGLRWRHQDADRPRMSRSPSPDSCGRTGAAPTPIPPLPPRTR